MVNIATFSTNEIFRNADGQIPATIPGLEDLYEYSPTAAMDVVMTYDASLAEGSRWVLSSVDSILSDMGDTLDDLILAWTGVADTWGSTMFDPLNRATLATMMNGALDQDYGQTVSLTISELAFVYGAMLREYCYDIVDEDDLSVLTFRDVAKTTTATVSVQTAMLGQITKGAPTRSAIQGSNLVSDSYGVQTDVYSSSNLWGPTHLYFDVYQWGSLKGTVDVTILWVYFRVEKVEFYSTFENAIEPRRAVTVKITVADNAFGGTGRDVITQTFALNGAEPNIVTVVPRSNPNKTVSASIFGVRSIWDNQCVGYPKVRGCLWDVSDPNGAILGSFNTDAAEPAIYSFSPYSTPKAGMPCWKKIKPTQLFAANVVRTEVTGLTGTGHAVVNINTTAPVARITTDAIVDGEYTAVTEQKTTVINYNALISAWDSPDFNYDYTDAESALNAITAQFVQGVDENCSIWMDYTADLVVEEVIGRMIDFIEDKDPSTRTWRPIADLTLEEARALTYDGMTYGALLDGELSEDQQKKYVAFLQDCWYYAARRNFLRGIIASSGVAGEAYNAINSALAQAKTAIESAISFVRDVIDPRTRRALVYASAEMACMHEEISDVVSVAQARGMTLESYVQRIDYEAANMTSNNLGLLIESDYQRELYRQAILAGCNLTSPTNNMANVYADSSVDQVGVWLHDTTGAFIGKGSANPEFLDLGHGLPGMSQPLYVQTSKFPAAVQESFGATGLIKGRSLIVNLKDSYLSISDGGVGQAMVSWHAKFYGGSDYDALVAIDKSMEEFLAMGKACLEAALGDTVTVTDASLSDEWIASCKTEVTPGDIIAWIANAGVVGSVSALTGGPLVGVAGMGIGMVGQTIEVFAGDGIENEKRNAAIELYNSVHGPRGLVVETTSEQFTDDDAYAMMMKGITWYLLSGAITPIDSREGVNPAQAVAFPGFIPFRYVLTVVTPGLAPAIITIVSLLAIGSTVRYMRLPKVRVGRFMPGLLAGATIAPLAWVSNQALEDRVSKMASSLSSYPTLIGVNDEEVSDGVQEEIRGNVWDLLDRFKNMEADIKRAGSPEYAKKPYYTR